MDLVPVISSSIAAIGYDVSAAELTVQFSRGKRTYTYYGVPEQVYANFLGADSKGRYFLQHVKNVYEF